MLGKTDFSCCCFKKTDFGGLVAMAYPIFLAGCMQVALGNSRLPCSLGTGHSGYSAGMQGKPDFSCCCFLKTDFGGGSFGKTDFWCRMGKDLHSCLGKTRLSSSQG